MSEDLQSLLEKINRDGVEKARAEAEKIIAEAKARADAIVKEAKAEAAKLTRSHSSCATPQNRRSAPFCSFPNSNPIQPNAKCSPCFRPRHS